MNRKLEPLMKLMNPSDYIELDINLKLIQLINKAIQIVIEEINTHYPNDRWIESKR